MKILMLLFLKSQTKKKELLFKKNTVKFNFIDNGLINKRVTNSGELLDDIEVENNFNKNDFRFIGNSTWSQNKINKEVNDGTYFIVKTDSFSIRFKRSNEKCDFKTPKNFLDIELNSDLNIGTNELATKELKSLGLSEFFDYPKPVSLIKYLINMVCKFEENEIILDFFSGSATTAQAIMEMNAENNNNHKFIMIQIPEKINKDPKKATTDNKYFKNICEIGEERIRRAGKKIKDETNANIDYGFRVFKVDSSNMKDVYYTPDKYVQKDLMDFVDNIKKIEHQKIYYFKLCLN